MAGYYGFSMSNNAVEAYTSGEKPLSKWTKSEIIELINDEDEYKATLFKKVNTKILKETLLEKTSWHHTSNWFNRTDFYSFNYERLEELNEEEIKKLSEIKIVKEEPKIEKRTVKYLTWEGTRKYPKPIVHIEENVEIINNWAFTSNGKKSIFGNGFEFLGGQK
jgi:integrase